MAKSICKACRMPVGASFHAVTSGKVTSFGCLSSRSPKTRLPQLLFGGQFLIGDLRHQLRLQECDVPLARRID